jgi:sigma-B regulation protein RsbU (phosphoserine phosphatase)
MDQGTYGICESCHESIEPERLITDPLVRLCLDHLSGDERRVLEQDLELAARIQGRLLPNPELRFKGWEVCYHYEAAGPVSGDYCDVLDPDGDGLLFLLGDVSGKGVAASMLMAHLHAMFRSLAGFGLSVDQLVERANRLFCESTIATHYATLVCGKANGYGELTVCNAGHCPALLLRGGQVSAIGPTGLPVGLFRDARYTVQTVRLEPGDSLLAYTDGLIEARSASDAEYGRERLARIAAANCGAAPGALLRACLEDCAAFRSGAALADDLTIMALRRQ